MKKYIKKLLRENLISEDVKLAEKLLKQNNIPLDAPEYLKLRDYLGQKNVGFLGQIVRLSLSSNNLEFGLRIAEYIIENKELIRSLPNQLSSYATFDDLYYSVEALKNSRIVKKVVNMLTNKKLGQLLLDDSPEENNVRLLDKFINLDSSDRKEFLVKTDKYRTVDEFYDKLGVFMDDIHNFNFKTVLSVINEMSNDEIIVLYSSNNMILARIKKYSASSMIGSKSWCIVGDEYQFDNYTRNGENYQYFFFNFDIDVNANERMIAFTMDKDNNITACYDRYDKFFNNVISYLDSIGIKSKIFEINSRQRQLDKLSGMDSKLKKGQQINFLTYAKKIDKIGGKEYPVKRFPSGYKDNLKLLSRKLLEFLFSKDVKGKNHLDIHIDKFEDVPITVYDWDYSKVIGSDSINIVAYTLNNFDKVNDDNYEYELTYWFSGSEDKYHDKTMVYSKEDLVEIIKRVYLSNIKMTRETKLSMLNFLKNNGIDLLKLNQLKKSKTNQDLTPSEFGLLANRGEDMKASIQNKLSGLRRGEDVNLNPTEIKYAIDNGFRSIIEKYYKEMIPSFGENQLSYDDLNIYKMLGLLDDVVKVITSKANNYGIETLNSIEKSLYDMNKHR